MRKIDALLSEYGESHKNKLNKTIHWICVPAIFFSIVGLVWSIPADPLQSLFPSLGAWANWATLGLLLVLIYYITLSPGLFVGMLGVAAISLFGNYMLASSGIAPLWLISVIIFAVAWVGQFYGHKVEGKKPSFLKDIQFLLIGPAWLMHFLYKRAGIPY